MVDARTRLITASKGNFERIVKNKSKKRKKLGLIYNLDQEQLCHQTQSQQSKNTWVIEGTWRWSSGQRVCLGNERFEFDAC